MFIEPLGMYPPRLRNVMFKRLYHRFFTRSLFRQAHRVVANSDAEAAELRKEVPADRCVIRRNGIQTEQFASLPPPSQFRRQFAVPDSDKLVLFLGRISPIKNLETLIAAFAQCRVSNARLIIAGPEMEPDYAVKIRKLARETALGDRILFPGPLYNDAKLAALSAANLFVLPSHSESFGNAAGEAVAAGLPVVLTNTCGISPIIDGKCGRSVSSNVEQVAAAIHDLLVDPAPYCDAHVRAAVLRQLSWSAPVSQMNALYKEAIAGS
jgi:glycosyltransferase involved in cell wall biosynthesis